MTLLVTTYVKEGIVMAADSRMTLTDSTEVGGVKHLFDIGYSDTVQKLFLSRARVGIATFGTAFAGNVPIAGHIQNFLQTKGRDLPVDEVPPVLLDYFQTFEPIPNTGFHVAGYKDEDQYAYRCFVVDKVTIRVNSEQVPGAMWNGDTDAATRLIQRVGMLNDKNELQNALPSSRIMFDAFTLQDAIDFNLYLERATIDTFRFQGRTKTVGGPIDVLVIKPDEAIWIQRKTLHGG